MLYANNEGIRIHYQTEGEGPPLVLHHWSLATLVGYWNWNIYIMNADGTNQRQLTDNDAADEYPVWRP